MIKAYSYIRFSTSEQAKGDSLRRQLENARKFADAHNLTLDDSLRDEGVSAFRGKNRNSGSLGAFLKKVEDGVVPSGSYLIVENLDRLSRQEVHVALRLFLTLIEYGIVIVTQSDNKIYSDTSIAANPTELIVSIALMMRSHDESATKSMRLKEIWEKKRSRASADKVPMTRVCPGWLRKTGPKYEVIDHRDEVVKRIFSWAIEGVGTRTIAKHLNASSEPTWTVKKKQRSIWHDSYIKKILENPAVYGEFTPRSKRAGGSDAKAAEPIQDYFPAIIDRDTFFRARAALNARATSNVRSPVGKHRNILSGLIRCAACGSGMHYIDKGRRGGRPYLRCGKSLLSSDCGHTEKYEYELIQTQAVLLTASHQSLGRDSEAEHHSALKLEVEETQTRIDKLVDAIELQGMSQALQRRLVTLESQLKDLELRLSAIDIQTQRITLGNRLRRDRREVALLAVQLKQQPDDFDLRVRATMMVRAIIKEIRLSPLRYQCSWLAGGGIATAIYEADQVEGEIQSRLLETPNEPVQTGKMIALPTFFSEDDFKLVDAQIEAARTDRGQSLD
ncbi:recombinase family protein [Rhizobium leguminosarum]|uniref:recombinase family protein n=1 Tax=Rhizobium leguminosarum TaxID=384 RepID=UPI003F9D3114